MKIREAESLIQRAFVEEAAAVNWADLGCGSGTFTYALANCLETGSKIYAVDRRMPALVSTNDVAIECIKADMEHVIFRAGELDGILMANAFHYIKEKSRLIQRLQSFLGKNGTFLVVEYDMNKANSWVPFPLPFKDLPFLFSACGFYSIEKIGERTSVFGPQKMYACIIKR